MKTIAMTALSLAVASSYALAGPGGPKIDDLEFEDMEMVYEVNATDADAEMVIYAKAPEGMQSFKVFNSDGHIVARLDARKKANAVGAQQALIESAEPGIEEVKASYPEGTYRFVANTINGDRVYGEIEFSHTLPAEPQIDICDMDIDPANAVISWQSNEGTENVLVEVENDDEEVAMAFELSAETTSITLPREILEGGLEYEIGVGAFGDNGNLIVSECTFNTL